MNFIKIIIVYCCNIGPEGCKLASQVDRYPLSAVGPSGRLKSFSALTPSVKSLGLISVNTLIGMLDLISAELWP